MEDTDSLPNLIQRCRDGDREAFNRLFSHYAGRLAKVAEAHLHRRLAGRESPEDVVQSVFRTFFRRSTEKNLHIRDSAHLWRLLVQMTVFKARVRWRHHTAESRDIHNEVPGDDIWLAYVASHDPGPAEAAALLDLMETLLRGLDPFHTQVLEMLFHGYSVADIAKQLGKTRQSIYRVRGWLEQRLEQAGIDSKHDSTERGARP
jgi:DNA-directed RNA polymerase specialized sigma24 family protein